MYMTRTSGLPEPRHKSQLCFSESQLWFLVENLPEPFESNAESSIFLGGKKVTHLASVAQGLRVYIYIWSIGYLWGEKSVSSRGP